jgi:hypothetical protein
MEIVKIPINFTIRHSTKSIIFYIITNILVTMVVVVKCKKCGQEFPSRIVNVGYEKV